MKLVAPAREDGAEDTEGHSTRGGDPLVEEEIVLWMQSAGFRIPSTFQPITRDVIKNEGYTISYNAIGLNLLGFPVQWCCWCMQLQSSWEFLTWQRHCTCNLNSS